MRVLLVEEQPLYHDAVRELLGARIGRIEMSTAVIVADALESMSRDPPDLVIADFSTGDICGRPGIEGIVAHANTMVITLDARLIGSHLRRAQAAGAKAYIPKTSTRELMGAAFNVVLAGGAYFPDITVSDSDAIAADWTRRLTTRQAEVLKLLGQGLSNRDIAEALGISVATVKLHVHAILKVAGVRNRTGAVLRACG